MGDSLRERHSGLGGLSARQVRHPSACGAAQAEPPHVQKIGRLRRQTVPDAMFQIQAAGLRRHETVRRFERDVA